ncbi:MAG: two-component system sensor histidine kinase NtrB [Polyangiales bacterium]
MELLAGAAFTWCAVYVLLAGFFVILAARRPDSGIEYAFFSGACVLVGLYAFCNGKQYQTVEEMRSAQWGFRAFLFAPLATAVILHVTAVYADVANRKRLVGGSYAAALLVLILAASGRMHRIGTVHTRELSLGSLHYFHHQWASTPVQVFSHAFFLFSVATTLVLLVRAYVAGKREALLACIGGFVLLGTTINDVLLLEGVHHSIYLSEHGFSAFAFGLSYTLLARHERVAGELTLKGAELRRRARQLRKAYEELRAAQEELVRKEQLALVGELAAVVSHEVRNPLAIISNAVAGLRRDGLSGEDRDTLLSILQEETDRLNRLVGDLLRYARPLVVERHRIDVDGLLSRATELAKGAPTVRLEIEIDWTAEPPPVFGDPNLLRQVFDNLVQNACQAMPHGGTLTVKATVAMEDGVDGVTIAFGDTGEGMDTQVRSRAGTPFFTTRPGGTGLGLAICDRIVTAHGGVLAIKSRSGEGTTVSVFLPANRQSDPPAMRSSSPPSRTSTVPPSGEMREPRVTAAR